MFAKPYLQGSFSLTNIHCIALFSFDLVHWSHHVLFTHGILWFHQQLSQCACWFKVCWNAIISENSPHCSENSFTYGITTEIFFDYSFTDVSIVSPGVYTSFSESLVFSSFKSLKIHSSMHCASMLLLDGQVLSFYPPFRSLLSLLCVAMF